MDLGDHDEAPGRRLALGAAAPPAKEPPVRVCVIGGGAAGLAAAWALGRRPRTEVSLWEASARLGGVATTERSPGGGWFNDGVQAAAPSYRNVFCLLETLGLEATPVEMKVSFGRGETAWSNQHDSARARSLRAEIARFGRVLEVAHRLRPLFAVLPIDRVLSTLGFSDAFRYQMVYPLTALFFGTGNQTPSVSTAVIAAVFLDPEVRLFDYDPERLLSQTPTMYALPALGELYRRWGERIDGDIHLSRPVVRVRRRARGVEVEDEQGDGECFDEVVFACDAHVAPLCGDRAVDALAAGTTSHVVRGRVHALQHARASHVLWLRRRPSTWRPLPFRPRRRGVRSARWVHARGARSRPRA